MENFETVTVETDLLIVGGGMAACGAAFEAAHWAKQNDLSVTVVDKASMDRSGAVAQGLSAINTYIGTEQDPADYARMVSNDLMGITRDDLAVLEAAQNQVPHVPLDGGFGEVRDAIVRDDVGGLYRLGQGVEP